MPLGVAKVVIHLSKRQAVQTILQCHEKCHFKCNNAFVLAELDKARQPVMKNSSQARTLDRIDVVIHALWV